MVCNKKYKRIRTKVKKSEDVLMNILSDKGMDDLCYAIVKQACIDYETSLRYLRRHPEKPGWQKNGKMLEMVRMRDDCIAFFESGYPEMMCGIDGEDIMKIIRRKYYNHPIRWGKDKER